jgi:hypothetical protein
MFHSTFTKLSADIVFERIQSLSEKEFALGGPMDIGPRMSEDTVSAGLDGIHEVEVSYYIFKNKLSFSSGLL